MASKEDLAKQFHDLAYKAQQLADGQLVLSRATKGFQHFMTDLAGLAVGTGAVDGGILDARDDRKWNVTKCMLTIQPNATLDDIQEVNKYLQDVLKDKPWYEMPKTNKISKTAWRPNPFPGTEDISTGIFIVLDKLRTLGKDGPNPAADPTFIMQNNDGSLKVLSGQRPTGEYALPGGMNESSVRDTCIEELLEEVMGGSLFDGVSGNHIIAEKMRIDNNAGFAAAINEAFRGVKGIRKGFIEEMGVNDPKKQQNKAQNEFVTQMNEILVDSKNDLSIYARLEQIESLLKKQKNELGLKDADVSHWMIRLKCNLYQTLCQKEYQDFATFVKVNLTSREKVNNQSDPRGTPLAYMVTTPVDGVVTEIQLANKIKDWGLALKAGDDLVGPQFRDLSEFIKKPFCDHGSIIFTTVARQIEEGKLSITPQVEAFLKESSKYVDEQTRDVSKKLEDLNLKVSLEKQPIVTRLFSTVVKGEGAGNVKRLVNTWERLGIKNAGNPIVPDTKDHEENKKNKP